MELSAVEDANPIFFLAVILGLYPRNISKISVKKNISKSSEKQVRVVIDTEHFNISR